MEKATENQNERRNEFTKLIIKKLTIVTVLDLSDRKLTNVDNIEFPPNLVELNLSKNELKCIPTPVLNLKNIKTLNLSCNNIKFFDETPAFCHIIEKLNLSNNELCGPPYWVWSKNPKNLKVLDISSNANIRKTLTDDYFRELLQCKTLLNDIKMGSCMLNSHYELLGTFTNARSLHLSSETMITANCFSSIPCKGLDKCRDIERLSLRCTYLSLINPNIDIYKNLTEIDLSENKISSLPNEFCNLQNLEVCILSINIIMYLPDDFVRLKKLTTLSLDSNKLCMLPEKLHELENLNKLDVYDNCLYDPPEYSERLQRLDLAQNYFDEPNNEVYEMKKKLLRTELEERIDGRKFEIDRPESEHSSKSFDEELDDIEYNNSVEDAIDASAGPPSSPEDWDSDEYWVPHFPRFITSPQSPWLILVKRMMAEGNFCPMDAHTVSVTEKVRYEKLCNPYTPYESEGQFDDYSSDDSLYRSY